VIRFALPPHTAIGDLPVRDATVDDGIVSISTAQPTHLLHELTAWALANGGELVGLAVQRPSLEDVYLELTR